MRGGRTIFEQFVRSYLFAYLVYPSPLCHDELYQLLDGDDYRAFWLALAAPRSFAKSTLCTLFYPLFVSLTRQYRNIDIISATSEFAEERLRLVRGELENNRMLQRDFGYQVGDKKWANNHIILRNGVDIKARGAGRQTRGRRPDLVICDDIEDDEGVRSEVQRAKLESWYNKALVNTLEEQGCRLIHIGTLLHPLCLLTRIIENNPASANIDYSAGWLRRKYAAVNEDGSAAWPEKWSLEALEARRQKIGTDAFDAEFMNEPRVTENPVFRREWLRMCQRDKVPAVCSLKVVTGVDPAISKADYADYTAIVTVGVDRNGKGEDKGKIYVLDAIKGHWSTYDTAKAILDNFKEFKPISQEIEGTAYQAALKEVVLRESGHQGVYAPVRLVKSGNTPNAKVERAKNVQHLFRNGWVYIPRDLRWLYDQLVLFDPVMRGGDDDGVDALVYALDAAQHYQETDVVKKQNSLKKPFQSWTWSKKMAIGRKQMERVA